jgi:hypothetical protein
MGSITYQTGWVQCAECSLLVFTDGEATGGVCILGEYGHIYVPLHKYRVALEGEGMKGQVNWRHCHKCGALFFAGNETKGVCPYDHGNHDDSQSGSYELIHTTLQFPFSKTKWRWCRKCEQLFNPPSNHVTFCPRGGTHDSTGSSGYYTVKME